MSEAALRRFPRIASHHSVLVTKLDDGVEGFALTKTIALGGCCVVSPERLGAGSSVELLIAIDREHVIKALGRVVYERLLDDGFSELGVEFVHLNDGDARVIEGLFDKRESRAHAPTL
jgi:PilZ domain